MTAPLILTIAALPGAQIPPLIPPSTQTSAQKKSAEEQIKKMRDAGIRALNAQFQNNQRETTHQPKLPKGHINTHSGRRK